MTNDELHNILLDAYIKDYPETTVKVTGDGRHFAITVVSEMFTNLKKLQRQQQINQVINKYINEGVVHAVVLNLFTPEEQNNNKTK